MDIPGDGPLEGLSPSGNMGSRAPGDEGQDVYLGATGLVQLCPKGR